MHYVVPTVSESPSSPDYAFHSLDSQSPNLPAEIAQPSWSVTQVCWKLVLKFILVFNSQIACHECYHVSRYFRWSSTSQQCRCNGFQEIRVEDTIQSTLGDAVDQISMSLPTHEDIKLFVDKNIKLSHRGASWKIVVEGNIPNTVNIVNALNTTNAMNAREGYWQHRGETKFQDQADPLMMKATLETHTMRWQRKMKVAQRHRMEQIRSCMYWINNSRKNMKLHRQKNELQHE